MMSAIRRWDDDKDSKHPVKMCIEQRDTKRSRQRLVKIHWRPSISSLVFASFDFFFSSIFSYSICATKKLLYCLANAQKHSREEEGKNDKILNSFSLSLAFFLHKGDYEFSEIDGEPLLLPKREMKSKFLS